MSDSGPIPFDDTRPELTREFIDRINSRFDKGSARMLAIETQMRANATTLNENTRSLKENTDLTREMHEVWMTAKTGIAAVAKFGRGLARVAGWLRKLVVWATPIAVAVVAFWHFLHGNKP